MSEPLQIVEHTHSETGIYAGGRRIALLEGETPDQQDQMDAYARLFAAAPDLLSVCERLLRDYPALAELIAKPGRRSKRAAAIIEAARAAVAKARGG